jgi:hypothetical protein
MFPRAYIMGSIIEKPMMEPIVGPLGNDEREVAVKFKCFLHAGILCHVLYVTTSRSVRKLWSLFVRFRYSHPNYNIGR